MYVANCIPAPAEVACCISTISIDEHAHLSIGLACCNLGFTQALNQVSVYLHELQEICCMALIQAIRERMLSITREIVFWENTD